MLESAVTLGLVLGIRHASDVDHVCAVASLLRSGHRFRDTVCTALLWSLGHSLSFFIVGALLVGADVHLPGAWATAMELFVAVLLIGLGAVQWRHARCPLPERTFAAPRRARVMLVGVVHGFAGSAGVALLALATVQERLLALLFLLVFGIGVSGGMVLLTVLFSLPLAFVVRHSEQWRARILKAASALSIAVGLGMVLTHV